MPPVPLTWRDTGDGWASDGYSIRRHVDRPGWRWSLVDDHAQSTSRHRTLSSAKAKAEALATSAQRRRRVTVRLVLGIGALLVFLAMTPLVDNLPTFAIAVLAFGLALQLLGAAAAAGLGHAWDWIDERRSGPTRLDRIAAPIVADLDRRHRDVAPAPLSDVRPLPPEPPAGRT